MRQLVRNSVPTVTGLLTAISLVLVFGAVFRVVPPTALPHAPAAAVAAIPHVNAVISVTAVVAISVGWRAIRRGNLVRHRRAMIASFCLFAAFLALYLYKVSLEGPTPFGGPDAVAQYVFLPLLAVHVLLAIVCLPLVYYVLLLAVTHPVADLGQTAHPRVGRVAASLWLVSFLLGVVVYLLLYVIY